MCVSLPCKKLFIDYAVDIVNFAVALGITDKDIYKDFFGHADLYTRFLNDTDSLTKTKETTAPALDYWSDY